MRTIYILPQAQVDILEIWHHIAVGSMQNAQKIDHAIDQAIRGLGIMPTKGHYRADVQDERFRFWSVYSHIIAYRFDDNSLTVVRVLHGARDFGQLFT